MSWSRPDESFADWEERMRFWDIPIERLHELPITGDYKCPYPEDEPNETVNHQRRQARNNHPRHHFGNAFPLEAACLCNESAMFRCRECEVNLCVHCALNHKTKTSTRCDKLITLGNKRSLRDVNEAKLKRDNLFCEPHDPQDSPLYCETCYEGVCPVCYPVDHLTHEVISARDALERAKITAGLMQSEVATNSVKVNALLEKAYRNVESLINSRTKIERAIVDSMNELRRIIDTREEQLMKELITTCSEQSRDLLGESLQLQRVQNANTRIAKAISRATPCRFLGIRVVVEEDMKQKKQCESLSQYNNKLKLISFEAPDRELLNNLTVAGKVVAVEQSPLSEPIGSELKRCRSSSPADYNKTVLESGSSGLHQGGPAGTQLPFWNPWNNANDVNLVPLLEDRCRLDPNQQTDGGSSQIVPQAVVQPTPHRSVTPSQPQQAEPLQLQTSRVTSCTDTCRPKYIFGQHGFGDGDLNRPWGICCDREGNFLVANRSNDRVEVFSSEGVFKFKFGSYGKKDPGRFDRPAGIAVDKEGRILVVDKDNHRVQVFNATGGFLLMFGGEGSQPGQFSFPWDVAANTEGVMAVTDTRNRRIQLFSKDGQLLKVFSSKNPGCPRSLGNPRGICFFPNGDILVSDFESHRLVIINSDFEVAKVIGSEGITPKKFLRPQGIDIDAEGNIVVADSRNNRIQVLKKDGTYVCQFGSSGSLPGEFERPSGICITSDGKIAVVDFGNNRVQVF